MAKKKENPYEIIKLTVVFANEKETLEIKRGEVFQKIMGLKNDKSKQYLYHWIGQEWQIH